MLPLLMIIALGVPGLSGETLLTPRPAKQNSHANTPGDNGEAGEGCSGMLGAGAGQEERGEQRGSGTGTEAGRRQWEEREGEGAQTCEFVPC